MDVDRGSESHSRTVCSIPQSEPCKRQLDEAEKLSPIYRCYTYDIATFSSNCPLGHIWQWAMSEEHGCPRIEGRPKEEFQIRISSFPAARKGSQTKALDVVQGHSSTLWISTTSGYSAYPTFNNIPINLPAYVSCALGIPSVGYVMICFGVVNAICSLIFGTLMKYIGRFPIMALGAVVHAALVIILLHWRPHPDNRLIFFGMSGMWGVGDAVWQTQVNGLYGTLFRRNKEAAFSNYRLWESAGFVIAYAYSTHLCARMKLYVMLSVLIIGVAGYCVVEILHKRKKLRMKKAEEEAKKQQQSAQPRGPPPVEETDDEKDDIDDEMIVTHL
ncbi:unnamed protein product [Nezara viridula]|uniref:UNC93-like protein n=1 Tax=Nezara viridula TaxID=85310 RepID=A0A9P0EEN7_NEZVI|nr:unnamed protein product [Nezara viridula]